MTSVLDRSNYRLGSGFISPNQSRFILTIPKNASSFVAEWAMENGWYFSNLQDCQHVQEVIVLLRDPVERWISGIAQYLNTYILRPYGPNGPIFPGELITDHDMPITAREFIDSYNYLVERLLLDVIDRFDDHVWEQSGYLDGLMLPEKKKFFVINKTLVDDLSKYLSWNVPLSENRNIGANNNDIDELQKFFRDRLQKRPELILRIQKHYSRDQQLIKKYA